MENDSGFCLETEIRKWRGEARNREGLSEDILDELENHIRESVRELQKAKLSEEESFLVALHRLGSASLLSKEFKRADLAPSESLPLSLRRFVLIGGSVPLLLMILGGVAETGNFDFSAKISPLQLINGFGDGVQGKALSAWPWFGLAVLLAAALFLSASLRFRRHRLLLSFALFALPFLLLPSVFNPLDLHWIPAILSSPLWTAGIFLGLETGAFFKDGLPVQVAACLWSLLWTLLLVYDAVVELRSRTLRLVRKTLASLITEVRS